MVTEVGSAQQAIAKLNEQEFDVLVCDIEMPDENGYSLIQKIRSGQPRRGGNIPAVAVTAYGSVDDRIRVLAAGFQMHVPKPVDPAELVAVVASVSERSR